MFEPSNGPSFYLAHWEVTPHVHAFKGSRKFSATEAKKIKQYNLYFTRYYDIYSDGKYYLPILDEEAIPTTVQIDTPYVKLPNGNVVTFAKIRDGMWVVPIDNDVDTIILYFTTKVYAKNTNSLVIRKEFELPLKRKESVIPFFILH